MKHLGTILLLLFLFSLQNTFAQSMGKEAAAAPKEKVVTALQPTPSSTSDYASISVREFAVAFMNKHKFKEAFLNKNEGMEKEEKLGWVALGLGLFFVIGMVIGVLAILKARKEGLIGFGLGFIGVFLGFFAIVAFLIAIPFFAIWLKWKRKAAKG